MIYTDREMVDFVKTLGSRLASVSPRPKLMVGEYAAWGNIWGLSSAIAADSLASSYTDIFAVHQYIGTSSFQGSRRLPTVDRRVVDLEVEHRLRRLYELHLGKLVRRTVDEDAVANSARSGRPGGRAGKGFDRWQAGR